MKITELTKEQRTQMPVYRNMWIAKGLQTGKTDFETFDKYMPICYEKAGLVYPKNVIRVKSPLVGALASSIAESILFKKRAIRGEVREEVRAVSEEVEREVRGAVSRAIYGELKRGEASVVVDRAVSEEIEREVSEAVGEEIERAVRGAVSVAVGVDVERAVSEAVRGEVREEIEREVRGADIKWHDWLGGQFWVGSWYYGVSFANFFFDICELKLDKDIMERAEAYRKICESVNYMWLNTDFIMVCERPVKINRNKEDRLHSDKEKSIEYPDGWGLYHLNGVKFEENLWKKVVSGVMPFQEILAIVDIDQRTQAMKCKRVSKTYKFKTIRYVRKV